MNKWSTSLPSIISLCNDAQFHFDPVLWQKSRTATDTTTLSSSKVLQNNAGSLSDLSILIQAQPSYFSYDEYSNNYLSLSKQSDGLYDEPITKEPTLQVNMSLHEQFVPADELLQSLVAYADSFNVIPTHNTNQSSKPSSVVPTPTPTMQKKPRRRTQSSAAPIPSMLDNDPLTRHKSCDDLSIACSGASTSKPVTVIQREEQLIKKKLTKFVPSESHPQFFFATKTDEQNDNNNIQNHDTDITNNDDDDNHDLLENNDQEKLFGEGTQTTDGSKFEWGFSSDTMNDFNKTPMELFHNYEATTNIGDINLNYLKDLERCSSMAASMDFSQEVPTPVPPPPVVIRKTNKDIVLKQQVDIQLLRPPTPPTPAPIIIREIRQKHSKGHKPTVVHQQLESNGQIHFSKTPSPIVIRERPPLPPKRENASKPTILYRHIPDTSSSPPTVVVERLRPQGSTFIQKPPPIIVEKWLPYPPEQKRKIIYEKASPVPMQNKPIKHEKAKRVIVEYDDVNVIVNKDVKQRKEVKRVRPDHYIQQFGNSLYSNETVNQLITDYSCASHVCINLRFFSLIISYPKNSSL